MTDLVAHMISCERQPDYISAAIESFVQGSELPLTVFVDGDDGSYVGSGAGVQTVVAPVAECANPVVRCRLNTLRALRGAPAGADLLLLEDDVLLAQQWHERLTPALEHCRGMFGSEFVLALYAATKPGRREGPVSGYAYRDYCGNVAVVLSSAVIPQILELSERLDLPSDMLVKKLAWSRRIELRQTAPNLAQHKGDVSSTTGVTRIVRSWSFENRKRVVAPKVAPKPKPKPKPTRRRKPRLRVSVSRKRPKPPSPKPEPPPKPRYKDMVNACIATLPEREESLRQAIESLRGQVDKFYIYLNGHVRVPAFLRGDAGSDCVIWRSNDNDGAARKFWWADKLSGYVLTCDDDIVYPSDYVERVVGAIEKSQRKAVVGFHGVTIPAAFEQYLRDREVTSYANALMQDKPVHILGTGVAGFHSSALRITMEDLPYPNMVDIWFGILCQKQRVPMVCVARPLGWIMMIEQLTTIYDTVVQDDTKQTESVLQAQPWQLHRAEEPDDD